MMEAGVDGQNLVDAVNDVVVVIDTGHVHVTTHFRRQVV